MNREKVLRYALSNGEIHKLEKNKLYVLAEKSEKHSEAVFVADYVYSKDGRIIAEKIGVPRKGKSHQLFKLVQKIMFEKHGVELEAV
jgi:hypothetical protein